MPQPRSIRDAAEAACSRPARCVATGSRVACSRPSGVKYIRAARSPNLARPAGAASTWVRATATCAAVARRRSAVWTASSSSASAAAAVVGRQQLPARRRSAATGTRRGPRLDPVRAAGRHVHCPRPVREGEGVADEQRSFGARLRAPPRGGRALPGGARRARRPEQSRGQRARARHPHASVSAHGPRARRRAGPRRRGQRRGLIAAVPARAREPDVPPPRQARARHCRCPPPG